mmetsp:Transcript_21792/g.56897  ORF Transcript_21792/g.56897 Transcript_21792/m.56897 type:complete len:81 (+) Transcript_21792:244-486(+)
MADDERKRPADAVDLTKDASPEKKQKVALTTIAKELVCPITQELPFDPVMAKMARSMSGRPSWSGLERRTATPPARARVR